MRKDYKKVCLFCKKGYFGHSLRKYCAHLCYTESMKGKPTWNKGQTYRTSGKDVECCQCGKVFYQRKSAIKERNFCSQACFGKGKKPKPKTGKWFNCNQCDKEIWVYPRDSYLKTHFCNRNCFVKFDRGRQDKKKCKNCEQEYKVYKSHEEHHGESKFCSLKCRIDYKHKKFIVRKKRGKTTNAILKKEFWTYFSQYIRQRDKGKCISCGKQDYWRKMDAGHYVPRTAGLSLYFDERNVNCQCTRCNRWLHGNLSQYAIALKIKYGDDILEELDRVRVNMRKINDIEYITLIEKYKNIKFDEYGTRN